MQSSVWLRPVSGGGERKLSRDGLVGCAVTVLDTRGLQHVTMRAIAGELSVTVGALYWHVKGRDELLELALDTVFAPVAGVDGGADGRGGEGWRDELERRAHCQRAALLAHPWAVALLGRLPNIGPHAVAAADAVLTIAARAGFVTPTHVLAALHDLVTGSVAAQLAWRDAVRVAYADTSNGSDDHIPTLPEYLTSMIERHSASAATTGGTDRGAAAASDPVSRVDAECDARFAFALTCLLDGMDHRRTPDS